MVDRGTEKGAMGFVGGSTLAIGIWKPIGVGGGLSMSGASLAWEACWGILEGIGDVVRSVSLSCWSEISANHLAVQQLMLRRRDRRQAAR